MQNIFENIKGFESYSINRDGLVLNRCGRELTHCITADGYTKYTLYQNDGKKRNCSLHRLLAIQFIPNPENKKEIDHIDRNKKNNNLSNLRWATRQENQNNKNTNIVLADGQTIEDYKHKQVNDNRLKNNDRFKEKDKAYYEANKEHIQAKRKENFMKNENENKVVASTRAKENYEKRRTELLTKIDCGCGGKYCLHSKAKHFRTDKHIAYELQSGKSLVKGLG
jgi:hypothetical protein